MTKNNILKILLSALMFAGCFFLRAQDLIITRPLEYPDALSNPFKGFRPGLNDAGDPAYPYPTLVRDYIRWNQIENDASDGVQKIIAFCNERWQGLEMLNVKVIPRVYIDWNSSDGNEYWPADLTPGDWSSQEFKDRVVNLIYKLGEAWDDDPRVAWVQTGIIGYWGEQENPVGVDEDGWAERIGAAYDSAFQNKQLVVRNQRHWDPYGYKWGVYWDSYGHPGQTSGSWTDIRNANAQGRYLTEIIEGEVAYNWGEGSFDPVYGGEPEITLNNSAFTGNMIDVIRELHCTGLGWISDYDLDGSLGTDPDSIRANASRMQKAFGYRFILSEYKGFSRADQGDTLELSFKVCNMGSAPFYKDWPVAFTLIDELTKQIIWTEIITDVDITHWLPGSNYNYTTRSYNNPAPEYQIDASLRIPTNIPTGQYLAGISIIDPSTHLPGIFFAIENFLAESQAQPLCRMGIGEALNGAPEVDPSVFGDPLADDARYYSLSETSEVHITYPSDGASFSPPASFPVYVTAFKKKGGSIDSLELYINDNLAGTLYAPPYIFDVFGLPAGVCSLEARAYDDEGSVMSDLSSVSIRIPGGLPWLENFNLADGTKSDTGETAWTSSRGGGVFEVSAGSFRVSDGINHIGEFVTEVIDISAAPVTVSLEVLANQGGLDKGQDFVKLFGIIDQGPEVLIDMVDGEESKTFSKSNITGNTLQLVIRGYTTYSGEVYLFDNLAVTYEVDPPTTELSIMVDGNGTVVPSEGIHSYYVGSMVSLTAIPYMGYEFDSWSGDLSGSSNPQDILMDTSKSVTVHFTELPKYTLNTSAVGGTILVSEQGELFYEGTLLTLTAIPDTGYRFTGWGGDLSGTENPLTFSIDGDKSVSAFFEKIPNYTLTIHAANGSVSVDPEGGTYPEGTLVSLTASPNAGYEFAGWSGDASGLENPQTITMNSDVYIEAEFDLIIAVPEYGLRDETYLGLNYPNPFITRTYIPYQLSSATHVKLSIYNMLGQQAAVLVNEYKNAGFYTAVWNVPDQEIKAASGAMHIYRLETDDKVYVKMLMHVK